ncbi:MAG: phosphoglucosamine mutase [Buchnera aphidicola (Floraphis meitanensis)]
MNVKKYFGTDGIRGKVGIFPITPDFFLKFGFVIGRLLFKNNSKKVIVGTDTRISNCMLESALNSGLSASGISVISIGIISTPAIGYLTRLLKLEVGIVISASHNSFKDNGIKLFLKKGVKLSIILEKEIERELEKPTFFCNISHSASIKKDKNIYKEYIKFCKSTIPFYFNLKSFKIVLDCANGATYRIAPKIFRDLGANLVTISVVPNGYNINKNCGSTNISNLKLRVLSEKADIGLAFDGDGDRVIMVDHLGNKVNGDQMLYVLAKFYLYHKIHNEGVVGTVMSNNGLLVALKKIGIPFIKTNVGDRNIIRKLQKKQWRLGAESSGHVIILDMSPIVDGIITGLQIIKVMLNTQMSLFQLCSEINLFPQVIINVDAGRKNDFDKYRKIQTILPKYKNMLGEFGRIFLRKSGTESCFRILVEDQNKSIVTFISNNLKKHLNYM